MCLMYANSVATEGFEELRRAGQTRDWEQTLARLAAEDSIEVPNGLHKLLRQLDSWIHDDELRQVRKYHTGRHRFYIVGKHSDCQYTVIYVKDFKRTGVDAEETRQFQNQILRALQGDEPRLIQLPE
ncbi:MAG: hypothetical protein QOH93_1112 [Chloroflexia bacterium]|nr:hypothetical protein [Chloroflexia bacterium]